MATIHLIRTDFYSVFVHCYGLGWCGYTWFAVVRLVVCTAKFSSFGDSLW